METSRKIKMMIWFSLASAGLIALLWAIWHLITGHTPEINSIRVTNNWRLNLPFPISRYWDILLGPIGSVTLISLFNSKKIPKNSLLAGLILGALVYGIVSLFGFGVCLSVGIFLGAMFGLGLNTDIDLSVGLGFGLTFIFSATIIFGAIFSIISLIGISLSFILGASLILCRDVFFQKIGDLLSNI